MENISDLEVSIGRLAAMALFLRKILLDAIFRIKLKYTYFGICNLTKNFCYIGLTYNVTKAKQIVFFI